MQMYAFNALSVETFCGILNNCIEGHGNSTITLLNQHNGSTLGENSFPIPIPVCCVVNQKIDA